RPRPEEGLMLAVLEDALGCFYKYAFSRDEDDCRLFEEARQWIESGEREWSFSFENICDHFDLNPQYLRMGLERWYKKKEEHARHSGEKALFGKTSEEEGGQDDVVV
ncbi:MAG: hypothetical protein UX68_C0024G0015, partial [Parcubacteria group bacterium GW2011_GWA2_46_9]